MNQMPVVWLLSWYRFRCNDAVQNDVPNSSRLTDASPPDKPAHRETVKNTLAVLRSVRDRLVLGSFNSRPFSISLTQSGLCLPIAHIR
jgi:hypothetical protein